MSQTVQLATARELASTGSVRDTLLVGQRGGYAVLFKIGVGQQRALVTKEGAPRLFAGIDAAARVLRDIGITRYQVDASGLAEDGGDPHPENSAGAATIKAPASILQERW